MEIDGTKIDFTKQRGYFFNIDCMQALKQMPDKCIDLCIVDPPYGAGFTEGGGCQGWFSKYHQDDKSSQICQVERERDGEAVEQVRRKVRQVQDQSHIMRSESASVARVTRTGGTWARKYEKNCNVGCSPETGIF